MTRALLLSGLLGLFPALAGQVPYTTDQTRPVLVRLGDMAWVAVQGRVPQVVNGLVVAPALAVCDLLSLNCTLGNELTATVRYGARKGQTQTFKVSRLNVADPTTAFAPLARFAGYEVTWDAASKLINVSGTQPGSNWNWHGYFDKPPAGFTPYSGPLRSYQAPRQFGRSDVQQMVTAPVPLDTLILFSKQRGMGLQMIGSLLMGSVDVPNRFPGCQGRTFCSLPVPRDALWVLALVTAK